MTGYFFHIACLVLAGSVSTRAADSSGILTETDVADLLGIHNTKRGLTALGQTQGQPAATNMVKLQWDNDLAASAKAHADKCVFAHSSGSGNGENLSAGASSSDDVHNIARLMNGVESWYDEHTDYDFVSNSCNPGEVCGHYTQVVWATTTKVGCGFSACTGIFPTTFPYQYMMVCQYSPPGNYNGQKPYEAAATTGEIASACPTGTSPNLAEGLCVADGPPQPNDNCDISAVSGQTLFFSEGGYCIRLQLTMGGTLEADSSDPTCQNHEDDWQSSGEFSIIDSVNSSENKINFRNGAGGISGTMVFKESSSVTKATSELIDWDPVNKVFAIELTIQTCQVEAMCPTMREANPRTGFSMM